MYELVKTAHQQKKFEATWEYFCKEYRWYNDAYSENGSRYNLLFYTNGIFLKRKKVIGTIEFIPYDPGNKNCTVEGPGKFAFSAYPEINQNINRTWEIDKLCIHRDYQRQGYFQIFFQILYNHSTSNETKYYLGLIEKKFFRMIKIMFGSNIIQMGDAIVGPATELIPAVINIQNILENEEIVQKYLGKNHFNKVKINV
ncbi:hypothetical protein VBD025_13845 [Virgibacillus flavescens]|uniref:hypothetical protein n=1 Tax=Virgibacillus flavescens TaxID=1611422 RepID=UPI003D32C44E